MSAIYSHDPHFLKVTWGGTTLYHNQRQARVAKVLWEAAERGDIIVDGRVICRLAKVPGPLSQVFRQHPSAGTMFKYLDVPRGFVEILREC